MKKVLLASTALVLSAGVAAADVAVGGDGRMGIIDPLGENEDIRFTSRIRINFTGSGETDAGLAFGGSVRADNYEDDQATNGNEGSVFIEGTFGKLSMGDVDGGANAAVGFVSGVGLTGLGDFQEILMVADVGPDTPGALYEYSTGDWGFYASADSTGQSNFAAYALGVTYALNNWSFAAGYEDTERAVVSVGDPDDNIDIETNAAVTHFVGGVTGTFGDFTAKFTGGIGEAKPIGTSLKLDITQYALSGDYTTGATTLTAFYRYSEVDQFAEIEGFGLGAAYDLGGGASLKAGYADVELTDVAAAESASFDAWDFGISFSF